MADCSHCELMYCLQRIHKEMQSRRVTTVGEIKRESIKEKLRYLDGILVAMKPFEIRCCQCKKWQNILNLKKIHRTLMADPVSYRQMGERLKTLQRDFNAKVWAKYDTNPRRGSILMRHLDQDVEEFIRSCQR